MVVYNFNMGCGPTNISIYTCTVHACTVQELVEQLATFPGNPGERVPTIKRNANAMQCTELQFNLAMQLGKMLVKDVWIAYILHTHA